MDDVIFVVAEQLKIMATWYDPNSAQNAKCLELGELLCPAVDEHVEVAEVEPEFTEPSKK